MRETSILRRKYANHIYIEVGSPGVTHRIFLSSLAPSFNERTDLTSH